MATNAMVFGDSQVPVEKRLWQAVIVTTIQEWISGPLRSKLQAEEYLFKDEKDFPLVCQSAGMDVGRLRAQLNRLRDRNPLRGKRKPVLAGSIANPPAGASPFDF